MPWHYLRRPRAVLSIFIISMALAGLPAEASRYEFDQRRTEVHFTYTMALALHRGRFTRVTGSLEFDDAMPEKTRVDATIETASLSTGYAIIDDELKSASFFNVAKVPVITFTSRFVRPTGAGSADVMGDIAVNGVTRPVILKVRLGPRIDLASTGEADARELVARTRIQRSDFNMTDWPLMVADDVDIEIRAIVRSRK